MDISNNIKYLGLDRVLRRGSAEMIAERDDALLIRDRVSGAYFLACEDAAVGIPLLDRIGPSADLLMVLDVIIGSAAFERYGFSEKTECFQVAYYGEKPPCSAALTVRTADMGDLPMLTESYQLISPEELEEVVRRQGVLLGYDGDRLIGFIGEHLEGSMGLLYVFPDYRRRGFAAALQTRLIARTMEQGLIPFGQVEKDNRVSLALQRKLGMARSDDLIVWMWK